MYVHRVPCVDRVVPRAGGRQREDRSAARPMENMVAVAAFVAAWIVWMRAALGVVVEAHSVERTNLHVLRINEESRCIENVVVECQMLADYVRQLASA